MSATRRGIVRAIASGLAWFLLAAAAILAATPAPASPDSGAPGPVPAVDRLDPARDIGFDQKLGDRIPLDLTFRDETGREVRLADYFGGRPVLLSLAYYECPMLCGMALQGIARSMKGITFAPGREFEVVTVSFDPREKPSLARTKKTAFVDFYGRPGAEQGWHFLTGDAEPIRRLTAAVGFRYAWDESAQQFAHAAGLVVLTPDGRIARVLFGTDYAPRDLRLSLVEAASGTIGNVSDTLLLLCYRYDPHTGRYSRLALGSIRAGAAVSVLALVTFIVVMVRRERRGQVPGRPAGPAGERAAADADASRGHWEGKG